MRLIVSMGAPANAKDVAAPDLSEWVLKTPGSRSVFLMELMSLDRFCLSSCRKGFPGAPGELWYLRQ